MNYIVIIIGWHVRSVVLCLVLQVTIVALEKSIYFRSFGEMQFVSFVFSETTAKGEWTDGGSLVRPTKEQERKKNNNNIVCAKSLRTVLGAANQKKNLCVGGKSNIVDL